MEDVSIVIPAYNPTHWLLDAIASARSQDHPRVEIILVNDGSDARESASVLDSAARLVDRYIEQPNRGLAAARNAAIRATAGSFFVPLDCDDLLKPQFVSRCLAASKKQPDAAFVYTDYRVFGERNYTERLSDYNLFDLLEDNTLPYAGLIRMKDWIAAGGYDESFPAYEDWEFWLRLASSERFGYHLDQPLWAYRKHGLSLYDLGRRKHDELLGRIRTKHASLYAPAAYARIKLRWRPSVCVAGPAPAVAQTICDWETVNSGDVEELLTVSRADTFFFPKGGKLSEHSLEHAALAASCRRGPVLLASGSLAVPRSALRQQAGGVRVQAQGNDHQHWPAAISLGFPKRFLTTLWRHLTNAELLTADAWLKHPVRSALRLIPLRLKERVNRIAGFSLFDLTFYLKFQPQSLVLRDSLISPVRYIPATTSARSRIALVTPHLGSGGAEAVLLQIARAIDRNDHEVLLIATQSRDSRWLQHWMECADHVYDLQQLVGAEHIEAALFSIAVNWKCETLLVQNALQCYRLIPHLRKELPGIRVMDLIHASGHDWDLIACIAPIADEIDTRIVISESTRRHLCDAGVAGEKIRLIRNGIDLEHFRFRTESASQERNRILFAARLDPVKRPLLLVKIAKALIRHRGAGDFRFVIAGDGPEDAQLRAAVSRSGLQHVFQFLGHVPDLAGVLAESDLLIITSSIEGIPMVLIEALASGRPVIASNVGAIGELLDETTGVLIERGKEEVAEFAAAIHALLLNPELRRRMGQCGRRKVELEYDLNKSRAAYRELLRH